MDSAWIQRHLSFRQLLQIIIHTCPRLEMEGNAIPSKPSAGSSSNSEDSFVTPDKYWFVAVTPAIVTDRTFSQSLDDLKCSDSGSHLCRCRPCRKPSIRHRMRLRTNRCATRSWMNPKGHTYCGRCMTGKRTRGPKDPTSPCRNQPQISVPEYQWRSCPSILYFLPGPSATPSDASEYHSGPSRGA